MDSLAPVVLFTYNRPETLKNTVFSLQQNYLAQESDLYIFSDAARKESDRNTVELIREYLDSIKGFKTITIYKAAYNKGLAKSVIDGVTKVINEYGKVIVLEDDLVTSTNFLNFMNEALHYYNHRNEVFSISGYTVPIQNYRKDIYFTQRASSWGWATWKDRWQTIDWEFKAYKVWKRKKTNRKMFNKMGSDMSKMLNDQMTGKINSWAIRFCYSQFLQQKYTVYPTTSKVINTGTDANATHTKDNFNRFKTDLDISGNTKFDFTHEIKLEGHYLKQFLKHYSIARRIKYKILNFIFINIQSLKNKVNPVK